MKAIFAIVDYSLAPKLDAVFKKEEVPFRLFAHGYGSADSELLELLGLGENKKLILISIVKKEKVKKLYRRLEHDMNFSRAGAGIAFSVPVTSLSAVINKMYPSDSRESASMEVNEVIEGQHELIITIVTRGYFDVVKNAAKSAGARGGTLIHGLGISGEEAAKFLGIKIQPEKDIIMIVVNRDDKQTIMKKIIEDAGILQESRGVCFSIPVDSAYGLAEKVVEDEWK